MHLHDLFTDVVYRGVDPVVLFVVITGTNQVLKN